MRKRKYNLIVILLSLLAVSAYAGIIYEGNEYTEKDMPFSQDGSGMQYFVVSGTINSVNSWNMRSLTINGDSYTNTWSSTMPAPVDGKKYFIIYNPKNKFAHFEIDGTNDWSTGGDTSIVPDTIAIDLPFSKDAADRVYFTTSGTITSISSWSMDTLTINGVDYKNQWSSTMPPRIDGAYYIYYSASSPSAHVEIEGDNDPVVVMPDTMAIDLPFSNDGAGRVYFTTSGTITSISSWSMDTLTINGVDYKNQWSSTMPPRINGTYYIYYSASLVGAHVEIEGNNDPVVITPDTVAIDLPFEYNGIGEKYFVTSANIGTVNSWSMDTLSINGVDYTNSWSGTMPEKINGQYIIYYKTNLASGHVELEEANLYPDIVNYNGQDYNKVLLPYSTSGSDAVYVYTYGTIDDFTSVNMTLLEINGVNYSNQTSTTPPESIDGKYYIKYIPKNRRASFEINGTNEAPDEKVYILNIKVFLQSAITGNGR